jgi:CheY-like chemotaxis protein
MTARILVVDDEPDLETLIQQKFRHQIREGTISFLFARDGVEALATLTANHGVDLVVADINMPRMDGLTLLQKLQENEAKLSTIIVSAYGDMINIRTAMNRGAFDFLTDEDFKQRLLTEATAAIASLGYAGRQGEYMVVLENTPKLHNMVVCTLCSCYPWPVLGLPPVWYKSGPYRSRAVMAPRDVLRDFGVELPADTEIRLWDSTAEVRYLVLPMRPPGTEGWSEERLASIVTRDCMIGTGLPRLPDEAAA